MTPVQTKAELIERILASQERIRSYGVQRLGIFGSFVRDEAKETSDVDFLLLRRLEGYGPAVSWSRGY